MDAPRLIAVLPCYSLDDIAKNLDELTCQEFHACWTALWHPGLLAKTNALPEWKRADQGSLDLENGLVICPASASESIDTPLTERLESQNCQLIFGESDRNKIIGLIDPLFDGQLSTAPVSPPMAVASVADHLLNEDAPKDDAPNDDAPKDDAPNDDAPNDDAPELDLTGSPKQPVGIEDFYALGFAYLMLQALTRKVHYSSNLDVVLMAEQAKSAAIAFLGNDSSGCERWLQSCFDQLSQERDRYFTQAANLLDLTLLAPSTLGRSLSQQLQSAHPQNILATASLLAELSTTQPETWQLFLERHTAQRLGVVGGLLRERLHPWFPLGTLQRDLIRGHDAYQALGISPPKVFSRFDAGMSIDLPTHLRSAGFIGVLLHAFSDGSCPVTSQAKISWEATDTTSLDAISSAVLDAASYKSVFDAINELAKQFDHHQVPTLTCVHWPTRTSVAFDDLLRASRRTNAFGEWKTFEDYFATTGYVYSNENFKPSQFKFPWPESYTDYSARSLRLQEQLRRSAALESTRNVAVIANQVIQSMPNRDVADTTIDEVISQINALLAQSDDRAGLEKALSIDPMEATTLDSLRAKIAGQLAKLLPRTPANNTLKNGWLIINPLSGPRRYFLKRLAGSFTKTADNRIYESIPDHRETDHRETDLVVDAPPMGVVLLSDDAKQGGSILQNATRNNGPNLASQNLLLANEFIECQVDPKSGYLRSTMIAKKRGGRLSGMPAIAMIDPQSPKKPIYSTIENTTSKILSNTPLHSEIESTGDLVFDRKRIAKFQLGFGLWRGSRSIDLRLRIEMLDYQVNSKQALWDRVPIWRTAWPSQAAALSAWIHGTKTKITSSPFFAPELIEVDDVEHRIYLTFAGVPIHRRVDMSFLDTLLPIDSHGVCEQQWQIAVDWPRPYQSYLESLDTPWMIADNAGSLQAGSSLWFAQANVPNIRVDPLASSDRLRLVLHETMGKQGRAKLSFFRDATSAARVDHQGNVIEDLEVDKGQVVIDFKPNEISYIDVC